MRGARAAAVTWIAVLGCLLLASCRGSSGHSGSPAVGPAPVPSGFQVSDTPYWHLAYPSGWTTDETTPEGEHNFNMRGPHVTPLARCFAFAGWTTQGPPDMVAVARALLVIAGPDQQIITNETFSAPGAKLALRIERIYTDRAANGSPIRLHAYELHFRRTDNVTVVLGVAAPADHEAECQAQQIVQSFTLKPAA